MLMDHLVSTRKKFGTNLNVKKTKTMTTSKCNIVDAQFYAEDALLQQVESSIFRDT